MSAVLVGFVSVIYRLTLLKKAIKNRFISKRNIQIAQGPSLVLIKLLSNIRRRMFKRQRYYSVLAVERNLNRI